MLKVTATGAATGKSKGYARIVDTVTFKYFRHLSQIKKIQDVEKWVKLSTSWKKISFGTKPYCSAPEHETHSVGFSFLKGSILALCKERRVYRTVGSMKYKLRAKGLALSGTRFAPIVISLCIIASLSHVKESSSMGKLSRKRKSVEDTAELDHLADTLEDEIIDLVDLVEETAPAPDGEPADENLETMETNLDLFFVEAEELDDTLDEELMGVNIGDSNETQTHKNDADLDFEDELVKMFETTELLAAELVEKSSPTEKEEEGSLTVGEDPLDDGNVNLGLTAKPLKKKLGLGR